MQLVILAMFLMVCVIVLPPVAVGWALYIWATRKRRSTKTLTLSAGAAIAGIVAAALIWPNWYATWKYDVKVPHTEYTSVAEYQVQLADAGFTHVRVIRIDVPGLGTKPIIGICPVDSVKPGAGQGADVRDLVTVTARCSPDRN